MSIVDTVNYYMNILVWAVVLVVVIIIALLFYLVKVRKVAAAEEKLHYDSFERRSSMEYVKFDDIISDNGGVGMNGAGVIVIDDTTFVAGINVVGYNYEHASAAEKQQTMINAIAFANTIEEPIQMRQTVESVDIEFNIEQFSEAKSQLLKEKNELERQYQDLCYQARQSQNEPGVVDVILENAERIDKKLSAVKCLISEADEVMRYEKILSESASQNGRVNQIMFSYHYNPSESIEELEPYEIKIKAMTALKTKIGIYCNSVGAIGCSCTPLTAEQLISLMHRHMHPVTADKVSVNDIIDNDSSMLCMTSFSLFELEEEKLGEDEYYHRIEEESELYEDALLELEEDRQTVYEDMLAQIKAYDEQILGEAAAQ